MDLFVRSKNDEYQKDSLIAEVLCKSLEQKFLVDLDLHSPKLDQKTILREIEGWVVKEINYRKSQMSNHEVFAVIDPATGENTYPYAVVFTLFMVGKHALASDYAQKHCSPNFREMIREYVERYSSEGFPEY